MTLFPFCFVGQGNIGKWEAMPTGMQSVLKSIPMSGAFFSENMVMKIFLQPLIIIK